MKEKELICVKENNILMIFRIYSDQSIRLIYFGNRDVKPEEIPENNQRTGRLVEVQESGCGTADHHGMKHTGSAPGAWLQYRSMKDYENEFGRKLEIEQEFKGLIVISHIQFYRGLDVIRSWTVLKNESEQIREIEYVTSFAYFLASYGGEKNWTEKIRLHQGHNSWYNESRWENHSLPELGLNPTDFMSSTKRIYECSVGTWSSSEFLPMGCLENTEISMSYLWQIENNGSWYWEVGDSGGDFFPAEDVHSIMITTEATAPAQIYFQLSGPTEQECQWHKSLRPGDTFCSVPVAIAVADGSLEDALEPMILYRRRMRRPNEDNEKLGVIFNDYMNCLFGDSTTEKLLPLIDAAAEAGCEYFCIDCGWYTDDNWWSGVGEWKPSARRYPTGIQVPLDYIRSKGMIPGLWLEIETMGLDSPNLADIPKSWYFQRHGKPVLDQCRYQLDFRNQEVRAYATKVIDRMVKEYGVGYIKMDYNINGGSGTELHSDSLGDGLLEHNRAYLQWLDSIFAQYPELIIENCGSGGLRMDYAMLMRHSIQSSSDQTDYLKNASIAAASAIAVNPEQCAIWSYPLSTADREEVAVNMINAILFRIHQSGHLANLPTEQFALVKEGITVYKKIREDIKRCVPFWPTGIPRYADEYFTYGAKCGQTVYLAIWKIKGEDVLEVPFKYELTQGAKVELLYPSFAQASCKIADSHRLQIQLAGKRKARLYKISL